MRTINIIPAVILTLLACACSVKEERNDCPCWLQIDLSTCSHFADRVSLKGWTATSPLFGVQVLREDFPSGHEEAVPRTMVSYCASTSPESSRYSGMSVIIPEGEQSDRFYAYRADVPAFGETVCDRVSLHKQYATVALRIYDEKAGCTVRVVGDWSGIDLTTLGPLPGRFSFTPEKTGEGVWYFRLPRQGDDSLIMEITGATGYTFPYRLGEEIRKTGYDWDAEDLDDIMLGVDYASGRVSVSVIPWETGLGYDEIL